MMNKNIKITALGLMAAIAVTNASATDLPSRTNVPFPPQRDIVELVEPQFYVGGFAGARFTDRRASWDRNARMGVVAGWQPFSYARVEGVYEYGWNGRGSHDSNALFVNAIAQYPLSSPIGDFTPYVLAGTGYRWARRDESVWNVGAGVRYSITSNVEADLRYRYVSDYNVRGQDNVVTLGLNYRF
jgi:opacity protein-like surface antigen